MRIVLFLLFVLSAPQNVQAQDHALANAARTQIGVTVVYDPAYVSLSFPGGDVDPARGVCTDVVIRALRTAWGIDLQLAVNRDMKHNFASYPIIWGLTNTDRNIDHRRVPNLQTLLTRIGAQIPLSNNANDYSPGDLVTYMLPGNLPHIAIISEKVGQNGPLIIHNIGRGTAEEDRIFDFEITGHYRLNPDSFAKLSALGTP